VPFLIVDTSFGLKIMFEPRRRFLFTLYRN